MVPGPRIVPDIETLSELLVIRERSKELEIEKDKYREVMTNKMIQSIESFKIWYLAAFWRI